MKLSRWSKKWKQYRYRFVPWLVFNLNKRSVRSNTEDKSKVLCLTQHEFIAFLHNFLDILHERLGKTSCPRRQHEIGQAVQRDVSGFALDRCISCLPYGGTGVKVMDGHVPAGHITSLYPGLIYETQDPIFFQSLGNPFIFRCADRTLIDGNDKGLSKSLFKSCRGRDSCWPLPACDASWMTDTPQCPLNVGQYVNNHTRDFPANVAYEEFHIPVEFPASLRQYLPNNHYAPISQLTPGTERVLPVVALVSLRDIECGEELFSSYFTIVR